MKEHCIIQNLRILKEPIKEDGFKIHSTLDDDCNYSTEIETKVINNLRLN